MPREYPEYPLVGVGAVVLREGSVLLVRRGAPPGRGKWSVPGGLVELGETPEEAVGRELLEETGLRGAVRGLFGVYQYVERDGHGRVRYHFILLDYLIDPEGGTPRPGTDAEDARFFDLADALKLDLTETTRELLKDLVGFGPAPLGRCR
ncbi:MAG: NUDIX hydrolase [Thermoproteus sp.]|jgi:ADP-ribose pyrophosphatase YjhB (NUDIX family)|nr:NUDIX hydrolase [Thermoproteus sp.]